MTNGTAGPEEATPVEQLSSLILSSTGSLPPDPSPLFLCHFLLCTSVLTKLDLPSALRKHSRYWSLRGELLGPSALLLHAPSPLAALLEGSPFLVAPAGARNSLGQRLIYARPRFLDWTVYSTASAIACYWFVFERLLLEDPIVAERGIVAVDNLTGVGLQNMNPAFTCAAVRSIVAMPIRMEGAYRVVHNNDLFHSLFFHVNKFLPRRLLAKMEVLGSKHERLLEVLPEEAIPEALGGTLEVEGDAI